MAVKRKASPATITEQVADERRLNDYLDELADLRDERDDISKQMENLQADIIALMDKHKKTGHKNARLSATIVRASRLVIDEGKLARRLGNRGWMKVSVRVLDKKKLEARVASGEIDPMIVAECSDENENKPYVRITLNKKGVAK